MPEGPELHLTSKFVNNVCEGRLFTGQVVKSEVSVKNPDVDWCEDSYTITALSRGKEMKLSLCKVDGKKTSKLSTSKSMDIVFRFGMSGQFKFSPKSEMHKHAHLNFFVKDSDMVLSFVDVRRFGHWEPHGTWSTDRGPCVLFESEAFRDNVLSNLENAAFNKPICEALLNQKFFNGVGNYLRAEVLYRAGIPPFVRARDALRPLLDKPSIKTEKPDILVLCNQLALEVINLNGKGYSVEKSDDVYSGFDEWLQCYYQPGMKNMTDSNGRTIWFQGSPGPMAPKDGKSRAKKRHSSPKKKSENSEPDVKKNKQVKSEVTGKKIKVKMEKDVNVKKSQRKSKTEKTTVKKEQKSVKEPSRRSSRLKNKS